MGNGRASAVGTDFFANTEEYVARMQEHVPLEDPRPLETILALYRMGSPEKQRVAAEVDRLRGLLADARPYLAKVLAEAWAARDSCVSDEDPTWYEPGINKLEGLADRIKAALPQSPAG